MQRKKNGHKITIQKLLVAVTYTANMGVDCAEQLHSFYFTGSQGRKWYSYIFGFLVSVSAYQEGNNAGVSSRIS